MKKSKLKSKFSKLESILEVVLPSVCSTIHHTKLCATAGTGIISLISPAFLAPRLLFSFLDLDKRTRSL